MDRSKGLEHLQPQHAFLGAGFKMGAGGFAQESRA